MKALKAASAIIVLGLAFASNSAFAEKIIIKHDRGWHHPPVYHHHDHKVVIIKHH